MIRVLLLFCAQVGLATAVIGQETGHPAKPELVASDELLRFQAATRYSHERKGTAVLIMRRGEVIFEDYAPEWNADKPHLLASGTKSFSGVLAVCAVQDHYLELDEWVSDTIVEWKDDPAKNRITIRQLLSLCSGLEGGPKGRVPSYQEAVRSATSNAKPGTKFNYGPIPFQCFGELMKRKLEPKGLTVESYLKQRILDPIGMNVAFWRKGPDGNPNLPSGAYLTPREWAKFGEFIRLEGAWQGEELIPNDLLKACFQQSEASRIYGMTWWLLGRRAKGQGGEGELGRNQRRNRRSANADTLALAVPEDTVAAMGLGKNHCYVIPSKEMVVVRMGDSQGEDFNELQFLSKLFR